MVTAFVGTVVIFGCFAGAAFYAKRRTYLYMGGYLLSCLMNLFVLSLANIFFRLAIIDLLWLYGGLFLFCGFVLYDTHRTRRSHRSKCARTLTHGCCR